VLDRDFFTLYVFKIEIYQIAYTIIDLVLARETRTLIELLRVLIKDSYVDG
jgi:hypothetical protein